MKNLENFKVQELEVRECQNINGGLIGIIISGFIGGYAFEKGRQLGLHPF
ncbi:hypothetical protein M0D21_22775 [Aquimarina sp. D1M17]|nr:hypothetical protein [Aquimarina acroporae]MCK8524418.1 hypothetical protein [Aquimarina acroporae]MCK8524420.1 hypothetical protein [Aquimarina acroporae]